MKSFLKKIYFFGYKYKCNVCNKSFRKFKVGGLKNKIFTDLSIIGGGYRSNYRCPHCGSNDRIRLVYYFLQNKINFENINKILHVAPEEKIENYLKKFNVEYSSLDVNSKNVTFTEDITNLSLEDQSYDFVICNHVLEHVSNDIKAIEEIYRILKKGGRAVIQVPISLKLDETLEQESHWSDEQREKYFGQHDHVRLHGRDFPSRLASAGFVVDTYKWWHDESSKLLDKFGFTMNEKIFLCKKI
tara:strand:- start:4858 stop:5589 length:732 start_codon:yes stop_codon:yes gene_type:complete